MLIIDELIEELTSKASKIRIPKIKRVTIGLLFVLIELENGISGLSFNNIEKFHPHLKEAGYLTSFSLFDLMKKAKMKGIEKSIGIAAINTMSQLFLPEYNMRTDIDTIDFMKLNEKDSLGMIGNMFPLVEQVKDKVNALTIIEKTPERQKGPKGVKIFSNYKNLSDINKLIITGSAILSDELDEIIDTYKELDKIVIIGPTMGSIPDPFFKRKIDAIGGMTIKEPNQVQQIIRESGGTPNFKKYCEKYLIINQ